jgi:transposase
MIDPAKAAEIVRLHFAEKWPVGTIAAQLGLHHDAVERVIGDEEAKGLPSPVPERPSRITPFVPFIIATFEKYPKLAGTRLHAMCRERGYVGGVDHFRRRANEYRPKRSTREGKGTEAFLRLPSLPGEEAQVDWGHFGRVLVGRAQRMLVAFVMVLSFSRRVFLRFFLGQKTENFLRGHEEAFDAFRGVPRVVLVDNLKSAVLERIGSAIRFNPTLLSFAAHYRFEVRPVAVARGNEKGRVERAIRFVRESFFAAREWRDLSDLNAQARAWCEGEADGRLWPGDRASGKTVRDAYEEEKPRLLPLPPSPYPCEERVEVAVGKTPYVRFDLNDYSVPHTCVRKTLTVLASEETVRIFDGTALVAEHRRSFDRGRTIEDAAHIERLEKEKTEARRGRGQDRLARSCPSARDLFERLAERGFNLGNATGRLLKLLDAYGAEQLEKAIAEAIEKDTPHVHAVTNILDRERADRGEEPVIPVVLPDNEAVRNLTVKPHALSTYDELLTTASDSVASPTKNDDDNANHDMTSTTTDETRGDTNHDEQHDGSVGNNDEEGLAGDGGGKVPG